MSIYVTFANMLYHSRKTQKITQKDAAEQCDLSLRQYQNIESGYTNPKLTSAIKIAKAMHLHLDDLQKEVS